MKVAYTDKLSLGGRPVETNVTQIIIRDDFGNPLAVAGYFGPNGAYRVSRVGDDDFMETFQLFGYGRHELRVSPLSVKRVT